MTTKVGRDEGSYWRVDFIQPPVAHDDRCIMLYGEQGEIVGPLTMELAEAWLIRFDIRRDVPGCQVECEHADQPQPARRFDQVLQNLKISPEFKEIHS